MSNEGSGRWGHPGEYADGTPEGYPGRGQGAYPDEYRGGHSGRYRDEPAGPYMNGHDSGPDGFPDQISVRGQTPDQLSFDGRPDQQPDAYEQSGPDRYGYERPVARAVPSWAADEPAERPGSAGEHGVQREMGTTDRADRFYRDQVLDHLNDRMREFVGRQEMFFLATADRHGECDSTFRAGPPGFVRVLDERTLVYPEYRGNGVMASLGNLSENPRLGILFVDFLRDRIGLHVNGRAWVVPDEEMRVRHPDLPVDPVPGRRAQLWVAVEVEEAYIHCAKHIPHLQKAPRQERGERAWGTDDAKRKGGDFFGAAAGAADRAPYRRRDNPAVPQRPAAPAPQHPAAPAPQPAAEPAHARSAQPSSFQEEAERVLALVQQRAAADSGDFRGWFG